MPPEFSLANFLYLGGVGLLLGVVQLLKPFVSDTRYYPLIGVVAGILLNELIGYYLGVAWPASLIMGLIAGLAASGLYSWGATLKEGSLADKKNRPLPGTPPPGA